MSAAVRFAPMTSALLARKGDAKPADAPLESFLLDRRDAILERSIVPQVERPVVMHVKGDVQLSERQEEPRFANDKPAARRRHSISLLVSDSEFERLGLAAIKKRVNRQQLLHLAIDHYLGQLADEYSANCRCIAVGGSCCVDEADCA